MKYRKKPVVIEAVRCSEILDAYRTGVFEIPFWAMNAYERGTIVGLTNEGLTIKTLEGNHFANPDDMVIQGVKGELYPCKPDIFSATYEAAD